MCFFVTMIHNKNSQHIFHSFEKMVSCSRTKMFVYLESFAVDVSCVIYIVKQQQLKLLHSSFLPSDIAGFCSVVYILYKTWQTTC